MTKDEALKMAIETLEAFEITGYCDETIQACKEALEQPAQGMKAVSYPKDNKWIDMVEQPTRLVSYAPDKSTCTLNIDGEEVYFNREQLAQEPVAWISESTLKHSEEYVHESRS